MIRLQAGILALMLCATSGVFSVLSFFCPMADMVSSSCCCKKSKASGAGVQPDQASQSDKLMRAACCEVLVAEVEHHPVLRAEGSQVHVDAQPLVAVEPAVVRPVSWWLENEVATRLLAHECTFATGPPLYVAHCTYLI